MGVHAAKVRNAVHYAKRDKVQRLSPVRGCQKQQQEYGAIHKGVGENPLNGKGVLQHGANVLDGEIVLTSYESTRSVNKDHADYMKYKLKRRCAMGKRTYWTTETFLKEMKIKHPTIEISGEYINSKAKMMCRCTIDGHIWYPSANSLVVGYGCPVCGHKRSDEARRKSQIEFENEITSKNPNIEVLGKHTGAFHKVKLHCKLCGLIWEAVPAYLHKSNEICPNCARNNLTKRQTKSNEIFVEQLSISNPTIVPLEKYINSHALLHVKCCIHGYDWYADPDSLLQGHNGCLKCGRFKTENKIESILINWGFVVERQKRFKDCKDKHTLPF